MRLQSMCGRIYNNACLCSCFRVDKKKTRLIGAICGLGASSNSNHGLLPDHDVELPFDVSISNIDLCKVHNNTRF